MEITDEKLKKLIDFFNIKDENGEKVSEEEIRTDTYGTARILKAEFIENS